MFAGLQHQIGRGARGLGDSWQRHAAGHDEPERAVRRHGLFRVARDDLGDEAGDLTKRAEQTGMATVNLSLDLLEGPLSVT
jgi:hypothetical protein